MSSGKKTGLFFGFLNYPAQSGGEKWMRQFRIGRTGEKKEVFSEVVFSEDKVGVEMREWSVKLNSVLVICTIRVSLCCTEACNTCLCYMLPD